MCVRVRIDSVIATLKDVGGVDDVTCSRVRDVLLAPHKHKDRSARIAKQSGSFCQHTLAVCSELFKFYINVL